MVEPNGSKVEDNDNQEWYHFHALEISRAVHEWAAAAVEKIFENQG